ncbi:MAG: YggU family protein [Proteobacteria bacterium]|nr:YggU family protein [Pseudomonadota bacterium]
MRWGSILPDREEFEDCLTASGVTCRIRIRVKPNCSKSQLIGYNPVRKALELALNAPPRDGEANAALIDWLRVALKLTRSRIQIFSGEKSRDKVIQVECEYAQVVSRLSALL